MGGFGLNQNLNRTREGWEDEDLILSEAMASLRGAAMDTEPSERFDRDLIRRAKLNYVRDGFRYWLPGLAGASLAAIILVLAFSQIDVSSGVPNGQKIPAVQSSRVLPKLTAN